MFYDQTAFDIRFEWGEQGVSRLRPLSEVVIIVDVLSFSTAVTIATGNGAIVFPYRGPAEAAEAFAHSHQAELADWRRQTGGYTLSPASLRHIPAGARLVLPSPNGSTLTLLAPPTPVIAGCLRNGRAVAAFAGQLGRAVTVIAAGERWPDDSLRPALEDMLGAGAIIRHLDGRKSPEALAAEAAFHHAGPDLLATLQGCASGRELVERGFGADVGLAAAVDADSAVPLLQEEAYVNQRQPT
jgi:2-phosphosulfolactate phosphatase